MNRKYRKTVIAGNWKMHKTVAETRAFAEAIRTSLPRAKRCGILLFVPAINIPAAVKALKDSRISIGAQNLHWEPSGAYTGEISAPMLAAMGIKYVIIGHSERRQYFNETDFTVNKKIRAALDAGLTVILCVGETAQQRDLGVTQELIAYQVKAALSGVSPDEMRRIIIAYEPVWAIGTGQNATPEEAGEICGAIRNNLRLLYGARVARGTTIQYGGSMNAHNAAQFLEQLDIDGGLIGSASLNPEDFLPIIHAANQE